MAKIEKASEDVISFVEKIVNEIGLNAYVSFRVLNQSNQKCLVKVSKASATVEYFTKTEPCVIVYVNENLWDMVDDRIREILVYDALDGVYYDTEKDKLAVNAPQINISLGAHQKYGEELTNAAESIVLALQQIEEEKKAKKAELAEKKKNKQADA